MIPDRHSMSRESALALLSRADVIHVAGGGDRVVLRPLHSILDDGALAWHCSLRGAKDVMLDREAEAAAHEKVAEIPSHFRDPENACPATTYYESVIARGIPRIVTDLELKARLLQGIMEKYQPEGGHRPIHHDDAMYAGALKGVQVVRMPLDEIWGKSKLGQNLSPEQRGRILENLRRRGRPDDLEAVKRIVLANPDSDPSA